MLHGTPTLSESLQITYPTPNLIHAARVRSAGGGLEGRLEVKTPND